MKTIVNVNRQVIDRNRKRGTNEPAIRVSRGRYGKPRYGREAIIKGPTDPLPCGARLWIETDADVEVR